MNVKEPYAERGLVFTRELEVPREEVFRAWTEAEQMAQWWGPHGFTNPVCKLDARPGGAIHIDMKGPDGTVYPMSGRFNEVTPERIVFLSTPLDAAGHPIFEVLTTVTLSERDGKTQQVVRAQIGHVTEEAIPYIAGMEEGWTMTLARQNDYFKKEQRK